MACPETGRAPEDRLQRRRALIDGLFEKGQLDAARRHRWMQCAMSNGCGLACERLDKEVGEQPSCGKTANLYEALKRRDFKCPRGLF